MEMYLFAPNPDLKPEKMLNYEISWLQSYFTNRLNTEITLFTAEGDNIIQVEGQYPNVKRQNIGTFSNKGIEFAMKLKASENLYFSANYTYLNLDKAVLAAPENQVNLSANYTYKIFNINLSAQHINKLYISTTPEIRKSYTLLNARVNAKILKNVNTFIMANNLLNENYEINYGYPMPKLNFSVGLKFTF
jgi:iron complex outermembrane receptor protein